MKQLKRKCRGRKERLGCEKKKRGERFNYIALCEEVKRFAIPLIRSISLRVTHVKREERKKQRDSGIFCSFYYVSSLTHTFQGCFSILLKQNEQIDSLILLLIFLILILILWKRSQPSSLPTRITQQQETEGRKLNPFSSHSLPSYHETSIFWLRFTHQRLKEKKNEYKKQQWQHERQEWIHILFLSHIKFLSSSCPDDEENEVKREHFSLLKDTL